MSLQKLKIQKIRDEMSRGKGGETVYSYPIGLEPQFEPFQYAISQPSIFDRLFQRVQRTSINHGIQQVQQRPFVAIQMRPSIEDKGGMQTAARIMTALHLRHPASFEVIGNQKFIAIQLAVDPEDAASIIGVTSSHHSHAEVFAGEDILKKIFDGLRFVVRTYRLQESHFFPISIDIKGTDPYQTLFGILSGLGKSEIGVLQALFTPVRHDWRSNILKASQSEYDPAKSPFFDLPDLIKIAEKKTAHSLFCCSIRLAGSSIHVIHRLEGFFNQFTSDNRLISAHGDYPPSSVMNRTNHATGVILNAVELSALIHIPSPEAIMPPLIQARRTAPPPELARDPQGILLGENNHRGQLRPVAVSKDWLTRHVLVLGATGSGKTIWQANFFRQFIQHHGAIYIDPSGDSAEGFLKLVPQERIGDTIYINPCDETHTPSFNVLEMVAVGDSDFIRSSMLTAFRRLFAPEGLGPRTEYLMNHALLTLLKSSYHPKTLIDLPHLFTDPGFRNNVLASVAEPEILHFWKGEYPKLPESAILPLLNKLYVFLGHEKIRSMLCQPIKVDLLRVIRGKKIFIVNLNKGQLGETVSSTLGFLILAVLQQTVMGLSRIPQNERDYFALILDEAHLFLGRENADTMNSLLSESRKFKWVNVIGTQFLAQADTKVRESLMGNVGTLLSFRVGIDDARILQKEFGSFIVDDLLNLIPGEAIMRAGRAQESFNLKTVFIDIENMPSGHSQEIINRSREQYYSPRKEISSVYTSSQRNITTPKNEDVPVKTITLQKKTFLECVIKKPALSVTGLYRELKLSGYMGDRIKKELIKQGYIKEVQTHLGKKARIAKFLTLTSQGFKAIGIDFNSSDGKGGPIHRYWQEFIKHQAEVKGFNATIEAAILGTNETVDLGLHKDGKRIAIEISITTPAEHEVNNNIKKCLKAGYHKIIILALDESKMAEIQEYIKTVLSQDEQSIVISGLVYDFYRFV